MMVWVSISHIGTYDPLGKPAAQRVACGRWPEIVECSELLAIAAPNSAVCTISYSHQNFLGTHPPPPSKKHNISIFAAAALRQVK